jgi:hypothetical protein
MRKTTIFGQLMMENLSDLTDIGGTRRQDGLFPQKVTPHSDRGAYENDNAK